MQVGFLFGMSALPTSVAEINITFSDAFLCICTPALPRDKMHLGTLFGKKRQNHIKEEFDYEPNHY